MAERLWRRSEDWVGSQIEDSWVMLNFVTGSYLALNETATATWDTLVVPCSEAQVVDALMLKYDVTPERCAAAVKALMQKLSEQGLATLAE